MTLQTLLLATTAFVLISISVLSYLLYKLHTRVNTLAYDVQHNKDVENHHYHLLHNRYAGLQYVVTENHTSFIKLRKEWHRYVDERNKRLAQRRKQGGVNNG